MRMVEAAQSEAPKTTRAFAPSNDEPLDVSVIVPTYREAENLPVLVPRIMEVLEEARLNGEIIVVDDNSADGTIEACKKLAEDYPLRLEVRTEERGLSTAVIHGMRLGQGEVLICMDADLSHPPETIPSLVNSLRIDGADFVIGSRYVPGGTTAEDWGLFRWLNSKIATWIARPLTSAKDPMAGFFGLERETFQNADKLDPVGYKIGLELIVKGGCRNVQEVPIHFSNRLHGESKLSLKEQLNYLRHVKKLFDYRYGTFAQLLQFGLVGASGMLIDLVVFGLLLAMSMAHPPARAIAIGIAMTWNFFLNRQVTFATAHRGSLFGQYLGFCACCGFGALTNWVTSTWLIENLAWFGTHKIAAAAVGIVTGFVFNFLFCRLFIFKQKTAVDAG